ncbi:metallophosphoesterase family protein [Natrialbaceae archaeon AArc-T1-2]|uniref:metallophosphoesterase family protein n=1 Tax=Natrialbaceae archaeon AArc-T1-2 TaxID=3053904 RepID=UPI00255A7D61|nr:metallophosphoesterase family protein [Natrialbaceae archaeon AArc-T1-2]WIV68647.1 metallophosphoesterase family protein [Natrialbaceae archaeon AArc-T1-2]
MRGRRRRRSSSSTGSSYVCYGHHHEREHTETGRTAVVNPGAHFPTVPDDHRTVAILDTLSESVQFRSVLE